MQLQEVQTHLEAFGKLLKQADEMAEKLQRMMPAGEEPALHAQCSVVRAFLHQVHMQAQGISAAVSYRIEPRS